jgi:hypothetical protein
MSSKPIQSGKPCAGHVSWSACLATAAGALGAIALSPAPGRASLIKVSNRPVSLSPTSGLGATAYWDVDGDNSNDFRLFNTNIFGTAAASVMFGSNGSNGRGLVGPTYKTDIVQPLPNGFNVGPTLASGLLWGFGSIAGSTSRNMMSTSGNIGYDWNNGFTQGDNYFGFRFDKGSLMHYGYGIVNFDSTNRLVTISSWAYNSEPDQPIAVGSGTEQVPGPMGLAGLAAGVAWTRKLRRRVREGARHESQS